jgi:hypothetical protein
LCPSAREAQVERVVTRAEVADVLHCWQAGALSAADVHAWAEDLYGPAEYADGEDEESVTKHVLSELDMLNLNLITLEDVPHFLAFLETPPGRYADGAARFEAALTGRDLEGRRRALREDPFYGRL